MKLRMCSETSGGSARRKSRLRSGAIVVERKSSSEGVHSWMSAYRCCRREAGESMAKRETWETTEGWACRKEDWPGGGEGAGVGGGTMGM